MIRIGPGNCTARVIKRELRIRAAQIAELLSGEQKAFRVLLQASPRDRGVTPMRRPAAFLRLPATGNWRRRREQFPVWRAGPWAGVESGLGASSFKSASGTAGCVKLIPSQNPSRSGGSRGLD